MTNALRSVLATIVDKVNNPSPDDPFEPDIAAVSTHARCSVCWLNGLIWSAADEERRSQVPRDREGVDEEVRYCLSKFIVFC